MSLTAPVLSSFDPAGAGEGSIDPLGSLSTYERLAESICPSVTARMSRIRFLTAIAAGAVVCQGCQSETPEVERHTPPWLVFEWYVVEALVRQRDDLPPSDQGGFPGAQKVASALKQDRALSAATYLKTPKVFGYTGVYRRLAEGLEIVNDELSDAGGLELLSIWAEEQGLDGFIAQRTGAGAELRDELGGAVREGLRKGHTTRGPSWPAWQRLAASLRPSGAGRREARLLFERLTRADLGRGGGDPQSPALRRELVGHLVDAGQPVWRADEAGFFRSLRKKASAELRQRLEAIDAYEALCRATEDTFRLALHLSTTRHGAPISVEELADDRRTGRLYRAVRTAVERVGSQPRLMELEPYAHDLVDRYGNLRDARELLETLLEHHEAVQAGKPPEPKRPWFERMPKGGIAVRAQYAHPDAPVADDSYVHDYRTPALSSFLQDLGRIRR